MACSRGRRSVARYAAGLEREGDASRGDRVLRGGIGLRVGIVAYVGWPILAVGFVSVLAGYFYTAGPIKYGRRGLGEVMVFLFMGVLMVMASYYVQLEKLSWEALYGSLPVGILVANILHANNLRDITNDRINHKVTIATMIDRPAADYLLYAAGGSALRQR